MNSFLSGIGILAIFSVIVLGYKKVLEYHDQKQFCEEDKVYKAANAFSQGASCEDVETILSASYCLNRGEVEEVFSEAFPHRADKDGGYKAFISSVNIVLGENVYNERHHK